MQTKLRNLTLAFLLPSAFPLAASAQDVARIDTTFRFAAEGRVDLSLISGSIRVTGWDQPEVKIVAVASGDTRLRLDADSNRVLLSVQTKGKGRGQQHGNARYEVSVPRSTHVVLEAVSASLSVTGTTGEIEASSVSGQVEISGGRGQVSVESVSGWVRATGVVGRLRAESVSGEVRVDSVSGPVEVSSVSGAISLLRVTSRDVRSETVSGNVRYAGGIEPGGRYAFESHSGTVRLEIPENSGARVSLETFSGDINSVFPIPRRADGRGRMDGSIDFTIGDGRARISAETFSGPILITRRGSNPTRPNND